MDLVIKDMLSEIFPESRVQCFINETENWYTVHDEEGDIVYEEMEMKFLLWITLSLSVFISLVIGCIVTVFFLYFIINLNKK